MYIYIYICVHTCPPDSRVGPQHRADEALIEVLRKDDNTITTTNNNKNNSNNSKGNLYM